jgi:hypothetical protein
VFVVGCPRSGTTLVRLILDANPALAIPVESHFLLGLRPRPWRARRDPVGAIGSHFSVRRWDVDAGELEALVRSSGETTFAGVAGAYFAAYAALHGKTRWGDKTPGYVAHLDTILGMFPGAQIVHVLRDGRASARSMSEQPWGPPTAISGGHWWRRKVERGREFGRRAAVDSYVELRMEDLTADPEGATRTLCDQLDLTYDPAMLQYHERATERVRIAGTSLHRHLVSPVTPGLRDWSEGLTPAQRSMLTAACGKPLVELGYVDRLPRRRWRVAATTVRFRDAVVRLPRDIRMRLQPSTRWY